MSPLPPSMDPLQEIPSGGCRVGSSNRGAGSHQFPGLGVPGSQPDVSRAFTLIELLVVIA
ncbi:MAG: type II secretion system protein, partial [Verrucomicrobiota bacterium]